MFGYDCENIFCFPNTSLFSHRKCFLTNSWIQVTAFRWKELSDKDSPISNLKILYSEWIFFVGYFKNWFHYSNKKRNEWNYNQSIIDIDKLICYKSWSIMRITKIFKRHHTTLVTKKVLLDKKWESRSSFSNEYDDDDIMIFDDDQAQSKPNHNHHNTNNIH